MTPYEQYLDDLTAAAAELEDAEAALWQAAREDQQADPTLPLVVTEGTPLHAAVRRVLAARVRAKEVIASAPTLPSA